MEKMDGVRPPVQERSRKTYAALLVAGRRLLEDRLFTQVTVQDIVDEAGSSAGSFYARFDDKLAFLHALHAQMNDEIREALKKLPAVAPGSVPISMAAETLTGEIAARHRANRGLIRAMLTEARTDPTLAFEAIRVVEEASAAIAPMIDAPGRTIAEVESRLTDAHLVVLAVLDQTLFHGHARRTTLPVVADDGRLNEIFVAATGLS